ncbi:hypothetical protein Patl1_00931 [Pistacia atlantica]|uniref:Uncharacterized protein n=1 Tax=Pistacia atlantica TaxID=434234 RepID=A0ACC1C5A0_9ROSI|nr:hypothetical protein Patl1_00931 [Pistacia atlantica]
MLSILRFSGYFSAATLLIVLSLSFQSSPPAEAIKSSHLSSVDSLNPFSFRKASIFRNADECGSTAYKISGRTGVCDPSLVHVAITLDVDYLRGSIAAVHSILQHSMCPESIFFHFLVSEVNLEKLVRSTFPQLKFKVYYFDPDIVRNMISTSVRQALEQPLNYARNYLADLLEPCVGRVIYLDSDLVVVDDIAKLWKTSLGSRTIDWLDTPNGLRGGWRSRRVTGSMSSAHCRRSSLVFAGHVAPIEHRWNQHGLGGDNVRGSCRDLHPGPVSLLHWSGSGKPWIRLDSKRHCPLDTLWAPYDLYGHSY